MSIPLFSAATSPSLAAAMIQSTPLEDDTEDPGEIQQQHQSYRLQSVNSTIVIRQLPSQGIAFQLWPAATTLVTLLDRRSNTDGALSSFFNTCESRRIRLLELGSGTGVVGIAAAALLGASVTLTDLPHVLPNLQFNVDTNAEIVKLHGGEVAVAALSWGNIKEIEAIGREYDAILGSDLVYHDHLYEPLLETLRYLLLGSEKKVVFLMGHLKRWKKESAFFKKANKYFDVKILHTDSPTVGSRKGVTVYQFVRNGDQILKPEIR